MLGSLLHNAVAANGADQSKRSYPEGGPWLRTR